MKRQTFSKLLTFFLIAGYLVFGGALGHGFVWCAEPEETTHIEFNLAGGCGTVCEVGPTGSAHPADDNCTISAPCNDFSAKSLLTEAPLSRPVDSLPAPTAVTAWSTPVSSGLVLRQLPTPPRHRSDRPPDLARLALRTTILRH